jgi:DMSO/TMAO reductase YedYZ molybdopterin-dependent catalytic subunit
MSRGVALSRRQFLRALTRSSAGDPPAVSRITYDMPVVTHAGYFYRQPGLAGAPPAIDRHTWRLAVDGLVAQPLMLGYADLRARPARGEMRTLVSMARRLAGDQVGNAVWRGCSLAGLLAEVGVQPDARFIVFEGADGYCTSVPLADGPGILLAYEMNGAILPPEHGFPLRALVPGRYGCKSPRWLTRIALAAQPRLSLWESEEGGGWSATARIKTFARIMTPRSHDGVRVGVPVAVQGIAFGGTRRIVAVAISVDGAEWVPVNLRPPDSPYAWTQWYIQWTPELPGACTLAVRATDETGFTQARLAALNERGLPDGSDAIHWIVVQVEP